MWKMYFKELLNGKVSVNLILGTTFLLAELILN